MNQLGLTPVRTARTISAIVAFLGIILLTMQRVLTTVLAMAQDGVRQGLARYDNFTGRFAAGLFDQDKQLLQLLKDVKEIFPLAETALTVLMVVSIVFIVIAVVGLALPRQFTHVLVAIRLLKWETGVEARLANEYADDGEVYENNETIQESSNSFVRNIVDQLKEVPAKMYAIVGGAVVGVFLIVSLISYLAGGSSVFGPSADEVTADLMEHGAKYVSHQKAFFNNNKNVGGARQLSLPAEENSEYFAYKIGSSTFKATLAKDVGKCPTGTSWKISASTDGIFMKELKLHRISPKVEGCEEIAPDFKNVGRKKKKK